MVASRSGEAPGCPHAGPADHERTDARACTTITDAIDQLGPAKATPPCQPGGERSRQDDGRGDATRALVRPRRRVAASCVRSSRTGADGSGGGGKRRGGGGGPRGDAETPPLVGGGGE